MKPQIWKVALGSLIAMALLIALVFCGAARAEAQAPKPTAKPAPVTFKNGDLIYIGGDGIGVGHPACRNCLKKGWADFWSDGRWVTLYCWDVNNKGKVGMVTTPSGYKSPIYEGQAYVQLWSALMNSDTGVVTPKLGAAAWYRLTDLRLATDADWDFTEVGTPWYLRPTPTPVPPSNCNCRPGSLWSSTHVVRSGDTVFGLAARWNCTPEEIKWVNHLQDINKIQVGQCLCIPNYH